MLKAKIQAKKSAEEPTHLNSINTLLTSTKIDDNSKSIHTLNHLNGTTASNIRKPIPITPKSSKVIGSAKEFVSLA